MSETKNDLLLETVEELRRARLWMYAYQEARKNFLKEMGKQHLIPFPELERDLVSLEGFMQKLRDANLRA